MTKKPKPTPHFRADEEAENMNLRSVLNPDGWQELQKLIGERVQAGLDGAVSAKSINEILEEEAPLGGCA
mgnify:CR=1 FL=1|jgi:Antitoxin ParD.